MQKSTEIVMKRGKDIHNEEKRKREQYERKDIYVLEIEERLATKMAWRSRREEGVGKDRLRWKDGIEEDMRQLNLDEEMQKRENTDDKI